MQQHSTHTPRALAVGEFGISVRDERHLTSNDKALVEAVCVDSGDKVAAALNAGSSPNLIVSWRDERREEFRPDSVTALAASLGNLNALRALLAGGPTLSGPVRNPPNSQFDDTSAVRPFAAACRFDRGEALGMLLDYIEQHPHARPRDSYDVEKQISEALRFASLDCMQVGIERGVIDVKDTIGFVNFRAILLTDSWPSAPGLIGCYDIVNFARREQALLMMVNAGLNMEQKSPLFTRFQIGDETEGGVVRTTPFLITAERSEFTSGNSGEALSLVSVLLRNRPPGFNVNHTDSWDRNALHYACGRKNHCGATILALQEAGVDMKARDRFGRTPEAMLA